VLELLLRLKEEKNLTYVFITHNLSVVEYISDRIAVMYLGKVVELARTADLFSTTLHPYTKALLAAIPVADLSRRGRRQPLQGDVPSPIGPPPGCAFHPRCPEADALCRERAPHLLEYPAAGAGHFCSCHRVAECAGRTGQPEAPVPEAP